MPINHVHHVYVRFSYNPDARWSFPVLPSNLNHAMPCHPILSHSIPCHCLSACVDVWCRCVIGILATVCGAPNGLCSERLHRAGIVLTCKGHSPRELSSLPASPSLPFLSRSHFALDILITFAIALKPGIPFFLSNLTALIFPPSSPFHPCLPPSPTLSQGVLSSADGFERNLAVSRSFVPLSSLFQIRLFNEGRFLVLFGVYDPVAWKPCIMMPLDYICSSPVLLTFVAHICRPGVCLSVAESGLLGWLFSYSPRSPISSVLFIPVLTSQGLPWCYSCILIKLISQESCYRLQFMVSRCPNLFILSTLYLSLIVCEDPSNTETAWLAELLSSPCGWHRICHGTIERAEGNG